MWTTHGHQIIGTIAEDPVTSNRPRVGRCGGPRECKQCEVEALHAQRDLGKDSFGKDKEIDLEIVDEKTILLRKHPNAAMQGVYLKASGA